MRERWTKLAGSCDGDIECPNIRLTERGTVAVQGYTVATVDTPRGEMVVEIPMGLLMEAADALR